MDHQLAHFNMIEQQVRPWDVLDLRVLDTLAALPRHLFVPAAYQSLAYADLDIPLAEGEYMLQPKIVGRFLQALDVQPHESVLEIGTGSGYLTALLASMGEQVTSVERNKTLHDQAAQTLAQQGITNLTLLNGDGAHNWPDGKRYSAIVLTGAVAQAPQTYLEKLELGGRLVAVVGQGSAMSAILYTRSEPHQWTEEVLFETQLTYLQGSEPTGDFRF